MGLISWILFGALAGWIASIVLGQNNRQGWLGNIIVGIVGSIVGGLIWGLFDDNHETFDWSVGSIAIAVLGAVVVLFLLNIFTKRRA